MNLRREAAVAAAYVVLLAVLALAAPSFFAAGNLRDLVVGQAPTLVLVCGMTAVILSRQIDISIGSQFAICGVVVGLLFPILMLFRYSLNRFEPRVMMVEAVTLENYVKFFTDEFYIHIFFTTLRVSLICTVICLLLGFPLAYVLARTQSPRELLRGLDIPRGCLVDVDPISVL